METGFDRRNCLIITRNAVQCLVCNKVIWSESRHDYRTCGCPQQTMVDGGLAYVRYGGKDLTKVKVMTEYSMPPCVCKHAWDDHHHGCVMNPDYFDHPLTYQGLQAQECEATQVNGHWIVKSKKDRCYCASYVPYNLDMIRAAQQFNNELEAKRGNAKRKVNKKTVRPVKENA